MREQVIERLARYRPGRRGFGGANDPEAAAEFRQVLADDPTLAGMTPPSPALRPAAVLVPLIDHPDAMTILLTQRTAHLSAHAGQISFPGGRVEESDADAVATALRETEEEVGLPRARVSVIGRLDTYLTGTGFEITPIVGIVAPPVTTVLDPFEVAEAFEVPLSYVLDRRNHQRVERESGGRRRAFFVLPYEGRNIWGATAGILVNLATVLAD
jgi:8-oxo-dGTP pyrophosphatase MutT (NUDIX family)